MKKIINTYPKTLSFSDIRLNIQSSEILNVPDSIAKYMLVNPFIKLVQADKFRKTGNTRIKKKG